MNDIEALKQAIAILEKAGRPTDDLKATIADLEKGPSWEVKHFAISGYSLVNQNGFRLCSERHHPETEMELQSIADKLNAAEDGAVNQAQIDKAYNEGIEAVALFAETYAYIKSDEIRKLKRPT